jgi:hypothetical protein
MAGAWPVRPLGMSADQTSALLVGVEGHPRPTQSTLMAASSLFVSTEPLRQYQRPSPIPSVDLLLVPTTEQFCHTALVIQPEQPIVD